MSSLFTSDSLIFILRWLHFYFGITWIGLLYYFNFVQGSFMAEADPAAKTGILTKLLPRALWWFRWAAMWTMVTGITAVTIRAHSYPSLGDFFSSSYGTAISIGMLFGLTMWANVWFVIWPNQKVVIQSATQVAQGGAALPTAAASGAKALLASRTNTLLSVPMLFFMGASSRPPFAVNENSKLALLWALVGISWLVIEGNALKGKLSFMTTIKGVISGGFALTVLMYVFLAISI